MTPLRGPLRRTLLASADTALCRLRISYSSANARAGCPPSAIYGKTRIPL